MRTLSDGFRRQDSLKIAGGKQIVILAMLAQETRSVRTQGNDAQTIGTREVERGARKLSGDAVAFERRGDFCVLEHDVVRVQTISKERAKAVHGSFETMGFFVVGDCDSVEV